jgi:hypothetical protein
VSTRSDFKQARNGCAFAAVVWLVVLSIIEFPFEAWYSHSGGGVGGVIVAGLGVIVGIVWTVVAVKWLGKMGSASHYEKVRWQQQEATRLRKKAWKEGKQ